MRLHFQKILLDRKLNFLNNRIIRRLKLESDNDRAFCMENQKHVNN